jgi:hypothetical protein
MSLLPRQRLKSEINRAGRVLLRKVNQLNQKAGELIRPLFELR